MKLYLCEKPNQAKDVAAVLGVVKSGRGFIETRDGIVTWCLGHMLELDYPEAYDARWKKWDLGSLPILPSPLRYSPKDGRKEQLYVIRDCLRQASLVIVATDPDREGEMIGREVMDMFRYDGPVKRLWLRGLDKTNVQNALAQLKQGAETEPLYHAARARSAADWYIGMNLTRGMTCKYSKGRGDVVNIGRVQTPTLALVVRRDREIASFKARDYYEIQATVKSGSSEVVLAYTPRDEERIYGRGEADAILAALNGFQNVLSVTQEDKHTAPPALFSLDSLQKKCSSLFKWPAKKTLDVAQKLYERHVTTYPRTNCSFLPEEHIPDAARIANGAAAAIGLDVDLSSPVIRKTVFNTAKVTAHHAIVPTGADATDALSDDEFAVYKLIAYSFIAALMPNYEYQQTVIEMAGPEIGKRHVTLRTSGNVPLKQGWKALFKDDEETTDNKANGELPPVVDGAQAQVLKAELASKQTKPPARYTDGSLLDDMKNIAKYVEDPQIRKVLNCHGGEDSGIGTPATRAAIIEGLKATGYLESRKKGQLWATEKAFHVYDILEANIPELITPDQTAVWEESLEEIADGKRGVESEFLKDIAESIRGYLTKLSGLVGVAGVARETGVLSWHPDHSMAPVTEDELNWTVPGYGIFPKSLFGRRMGLEEYRRITTETGPCGPFEGFHSEKKKCDYNAKLAWVDGKVKIVFDDKPPAVAATGTGVFVLLPSGQKEIMDCGDYYTISGVPGRFFKVVSERKMRPEDYKRIIEAKGKPVEFDGFRSKVGKMFRGPLVWNARSKPWPKVEFRFG